MHCSVPLRKKIVLLKYKSFHISASQIEFISVRGIMYKDKHEHLDHQYINNITNVYISGGSVLELITAAFFYFLSFSFLLWRCWRLRGVMSLFIF